MTLQSQRGCRTPRNPAPHPRNERAAAPLPAARRPQLAPVVPCTTPGTPRRLVLPSAVPRVPAQHSHSLRASNTRLQFIGIERTLVSGAFFSVYSVGRPWQARPAPSPRSGVSRCPRAGQLSDGRPGRLNLQIFMPFDEAIIGNTIVSMLAHQLFKRIIISVFINIS